MKRVLISACLAGAIALIASMPISGQSKTPPLVITAFNGGPAIAYTTPKTPWGDPDLQGVWSSDDATMPMSRPANAAGRLYLTDEEYAARVKQIENGVKNAENAIGSFRGDFARRAFRQTSLIVDPPDGRIPALTDDARERRAAADANRRRPFEGPESLNHVERCLTYGVPRLSGTNTGAGPLGYYQIVQTPTYIVLFLEAIHEARVISLDGRPHLPPTVRQWQGDSRGRWEGNSLVVDTTNFSASNNFMGSSDHLHLVERLTRVAPDRIDYAITIDDPTTWTKPWTAVIRLKQKTERLFEYACHEGNYEIVRGMLAAARAIEAGR